MNTVEKGNAAMTTNLKAAIAATSPWEDATLLINGKKVEWGAKPVFLRGQVNDVTVEAPPALARELNLGLAEDGGLSIVASPDFGNWVVPVDGKFSWKITPGAGKSGRMKLVFFSREEVQSWDHRSLVISSKLTDEADVTIDRRPVPKEGTWFVRDESRTVDLIFKPGSPLDGLPVSLHCAIKNGLDKDNVVSEPEFGSAQTTHRWTVTGNTNSGIFQLLLYGEGMSEPIILPVSRLFSSNLAEEVTVLLNGNAMPKRGANFIGGQANVLTLDYKSADLLVGAPLAIDVSPQSGVVTGDFSCVPALRELTTTHEWKLTGTQLKSGTFKVKLFSEGEKASLLTPTNRLGREVFRFLNLLDLDLPLPPEEFLFPRNVFLILRARLLSSDGSPLVGVPVTFTVPEHETFDTNTDPTGKVISAAYVFNTPGVRLIKAVAALPTGITPLEVLVRITGGEN